MRCSGPLEIRWPTPPPQALAALDDPQLLGLLSRFDDNLDRLRSRGADNWAELDDRMGFIVELFRSAQQDPDLFVVPSELLDPHISGAEPSAR